MKKLEDIVIDFVGDRVYTLRKLFEEDGWGPECMEDSIAEWMDNKGILTDVRKDKKKEMISDALKYWEDTIFA